MNLFRGLTGVLTFILPLVVWIVYKVRQIDRLARLAGLTPLPFAPQPDLPANWFARRFLPEQRIYLRQQGRLALGVYVLCSWTCSFLLSIPLLMAGGPNAHLWSNQGVLEWLLYLQGAARAPQFLWVLLMVTGSIAIAPLRLGPDAKFYRTRALEVGFLYRWRVLPLLASFLLAAGTGIVISLLLFFALRGPVWAHLPLVIPRSLSPDDADVTAGYAALRSTSAPRVFLSFLSTIALIYSSIVAICLVPVRSRTSRMSPKVLAPLLILGVLGPALVAISSGIDAPHWPAALFMYWRLGTPPAWGFVIVPVLLTIGFLTLGRIFIERLEL